MYNGIFSALVTPFLSDSLKIDYDSLKNLINYQVENSISGLVVCGSTGEAATLNKDEYLEVLQFVKDTVKSKKVNNNFKLIILSHNFDFYRTVSSRLGLTKTNRFVAARNNRGSIEFANPTCDNNPFENWQQNY